MDLLYQKMRNDVLASLYDAPFMVNQENDINVFNTHQKIGWKGYVDGGIVEDHKSTYEASYTFDFKMPPKAAFRTLSFTSYQGETGWNFLQFIENVIQSDPRIFVKVENLSIMDVRKYLFEVTEIHVYDSVIDDIFLRMVKRYFPKLECLEFHRSTIQAECNLKRIGSTLKFTECTIENIKSFEGCTAPVWIYRNIALKKIVPTTILSKNWDISLGIPSSSFPLKELFLKCNFPKLEELRVCGDTYRGYSFEDSFTYLPDSAPLLNRLTIEGKVRNLSFLTRFLHLIDVQILSTYQDMSFMCTEITDYQEREKIKKRNQKDLEYLKQLNPKVDERALLDTLEQSRIAKLCHFRSLIQYQEGDFQLFRRNHYLESVLKRNLDKIDYYYDAYFDELYTRKQREKRTIFDMEEFYQIKNNILYVEPRNISFLDDSRKYAKKQIVRVKPFLYAANGRPIILHFGKPIQRLKKDLSLSTSEVNGKETTKQDILQNYIEDLEQYPCSVGSFLDMMVEEYYLAVSKEDFLAFGSLGKQIYDSITKYERATQRLDTLEKKQTWYEQAIQALLWKHYDEFTVQEKAYLYLKKDTCLLSSRSTYPSALDIQMEKLVKDESKIMKSIQEKTDGLYGKYKNQIRLIYQQYYLFDKPYDMPLLPFSQVSSKPKQLKEDSQLFMENPDIDFPKVKTYDESV